MTVLVDSLLALARMDPLSREQLDRETVALAPLLERVRAAHAQEAAQRGIALTVRCEPDAVNANPHMLEIALRNLVDNALRYCPDGSRIDIEASRIERHARITVRDDGPGVDPAAMARLTERFFRVLGQGQGGSGLGLSIAQRIVELHGGKLAFGPGLDGRGLGATAELPVP